MQHDLYTWQVMGDKFIRTKKTSSSDFIDNTITKWLKEVSPKQREEFFDTLFEVFNSTNAKTLNELSSKWFKNAATIIKTYNNLNPETKKMMTKTLSTLLRIGTNNITIRKTKNEKFKEIPKKQQKSNKNQQKSLLN